MNYFKYQRFEKAHTYVEMVLLGNDHVVINVKNVLSVKRE